MKTNKRNAENKRNNKGFSLVELIVVIAIMAVLVAVAAPQFTRYIDRSRQSVDAQLVSGIVTSAQVGVADVTTYTEIQDGVYTITVGKAGADVKYATSATATAAAEPTSTKNMGAAIKDSCGELTNLKVTSNGFEDGIIIQITIAKGVPTVKYSKTFGEYIGIPTADTIADPVAPTTP